MDLGANKLSWTNPILAAVSGVTGVMYILFILSNRYVADEPIFPLRLLAHPVVLVSYAILILQNTMTMTMMMLVPMYFQVTNKAGVAAAGAYLIPSFIGNTLGGLFTGWFIKRTGLYKIPTIASAFSNILCFTLLRILWNGSTPSWQSLFVFFGGLATGISHSSVFVGLTSSVKEEHVSMAGSGLYLSGNIGAVFGSSISSAVYEASLRPELEKVLEGSPHMEKVIIIFYLVLLLCIHLTIIPLFLCCVANRNHIDYSQSSVEHRICSRPIRGNEGQDHAGLHPQFSAGIL